MACHLNRSKAANSRHAYIAYLCVYKHDPGNTEQFCMAAAESANIPGEGGPMCRVGTKPNRFPSSLLFAAGGGESMPQSWSPRTSSRRTPSRAEVSGRLGCQGVRCPAPPAALEAISVAWQRGVMAKTHHVAITRCGLAITPGRFCDSTTL